MVPLMMRSGYSWLEGTVTPEALLTRACELGYQAAGLMDVNNLCGVTGFWKGAVAREMTPLVGAELVQGKLRVGALVVSEVGYGNLCHVVSELHQADEPLAELLAEWGEGVVLMALDLSSARALCAAGVSTELYLVLDTVIGTTAVRQGEFALIAAGVARMSAWDELEIARLQAAVRTGRVMDDVGEEELPQKWACLQGAEAYTKRFARYPEALANNARVAELASGFRLLPKEPVFPDFRCPGGLEAGGFLRQLCNEGLRRRYGRRLPIGAKRRLTYELELIVRLGFAEYFLVVWDIVQFARRRRAPVAGRGSGASSLVAYLLEITNVCPLAYGIPFERFLHAERADFPDLDVDFCWRIRDDVLDYAFRRWGYEYVAMVSTHVLYKERLALRETMKACGFSCEQIRQHQQGELRADKRMPTVLRLARRLVGLPHHISVHPGGIVIGRQAMDRYVPVQTAAKGVTITQLDKRGVEDVRLVKIDILGNRNLSTVRYAVDLIEQHRGERVALESLPTADPATIAMIRAGDTVGCNQLESPAMRNLLKMLQPASTHDVMKALALIRPGAASIGMKEVFIRRHRGLAPVPVGHPQVDALLEASYGVMVYEDDVMLVAAALMNTTLVEADHFRRRVQKCHDDEERLALSRAFLERCTANGVELEYAKDMWVQMAKFNSYSFCRAHAASYGVLSYSGVWLKCHYPLEFWCAALNNNQSMYHQRVYVEAAKRMGIRFWLPDVNRSEREFMLDQGGIRIGLGRLRGLGETGVGVLLKARRVEAFRGVSDLVWRTRLPVSAVRSLIRCGACDELGRNRPALLMELKLCTREKPLAGLMDELFDLPPEMPVATEDFDWQRKYLDEWQVLGLTPRQHLMTLHRPLVTELVNSDSRELPSRVGEVVTLAGLLETRQGTTTRQGEQMLFATFDDEHGLFEVNIYPDLARTLRHHMRLYGPYIIRGKVGSQYGSVSVDAESITTLRQANDALTTAS